MAGSTVKHPRYPIKIVDITADLARADNEFVQLMMQK